MRIGWIGAGIMGQPMVCHLLNHQQEVHVYARHPEKIEDCLSRGAVLEASVEALVSKVDVICTMVGFPKDVEEVYQHIFSVIEKGKTCIDLPLQVQSWQKPWHSRPKNEVLICWMRRLPAVMSGPRTAH